MKRNKHYLFLFTLIFVVFISFEMKSQCFSNGGTIQPSSPIITNPTTISVLNMTLPTGGFGFNQYYWIYSSTGCPDLKLNNYSTTIDPYVSSSSPSLSSLWVYKTTWVKRVVKSFGCSDVIESNCIKITVQNPDTKAPVVVCPSPITVTTPDAVTNCVKISLPKPSATDESGIKSSTTNLAADYCFPLGYTYFQYKVEDNAGNTSNCSSYISVLKGNCNYSKAMGSCMYNLNINEFNGGNIYSNNLSNYSNLCIGQKIPIKMTFSETCTGVVDPYWNIYIDFNKDGNFDDNENVLHLFTPNGILNTTFNIPDNVATGNTKMRLVIGRDKFYTSCSKNIIGDVLDFNINLTNCSNKFKTLAVYSFENTSYLTGSNLKTTGYPPIDFTDGATLFSSLNTDMYASSNTYSWISTDKYAANFNLQTSLLFFNITTAVFETNKNTALKFNVRPKAGFKTILNGISWYENSGISSLSNVGIRVTLNGSEYFFAPSLYLGGFHNIKFPSPLILNQNDIVEFQILPYGYFMNSYLIDNIEIIGSTTPLINCSQFLDAGTVCCTEEKCASFNPSNITNLRSPNGGTGLYSYLWQSTTTDPYGMSFAPTTIINQNTDNYDPSTISQTTWYRRLAKPSNCAETNPNYYVKSPWIKKSTTLCSEGRAAAFIGLDAKWASEKVLLNFTTEAFEDLDIVNARLERQTNNGKFEVVNNQIDIMNINSLKDNNPIIGENIYRIVVATPERKYYSNEAKINYQKLDESVIAYPNPTNGELTLNLDKFIGENITVSLMDNFGHQIYQKGFEVVNPSESLNLSNYTSGTYFVHVVSNNRQPVVNKIVLIQE